MAADDAASLRVEVAYSPRAGVVDCVALTLAAGATVREAIERCGFVERHALAAPERLALGVWGRRCTPDETLRDGDRVEIYRPLKIDPKEARRLRYRQHRAARTTCSPKR